MATHWQPRDGDPVAEFSPEPMTSNTADAASPFAGTLRELASRTTLLDSLLLMVAGAATGAIVVVVYWTLR